VVYGLSLSNKTLVAGMMLGLSGAPFALEPFASCPTNAFLFQGNPVSIYGVNLLRPMLEFQVTSMQLASVLMIDLFMDLIPHVTVW